MTPSRTAAAPRRSSRARSPRRPAGRARGPVALLLAAALALAPAALQAHEEGVLELASPSVAPGDEVAVRGSGFEAGESHRLVLVGALEEREVGEVRPDAEGEFSVTLSVPADLDEGRYRLEAVAPDGDVAGRADLAVLGGAAGGGEAEDAGTTEARADDMPIDRSRSGAEWGLIVLLVGLAGGAGFRLLRR